MTRLHPIAGGVALGMIMLFWSSTVLVELWGDPGMIAQVKALIPWGFLILVPAIAFAGASGFRIGKGWRGPMVERKRKRMPVIAVNGIVILVPAAFFLAAKAQAGAFDTWFYTVQGIELIAGAVNITLLGANLRDGLRMKRQRG